MSLKKDYNNQLKSGYKSTGHTNRTVSRQKYGAKMNNQNWEDLFGGTSKNFVKNKRNFDFDQ